MKFENTFVSNFEGAFRGMRNPKNSWDRSDSFFGLVVPETTKKDYEIAEKWVCSLYPDAMTEDWTGEMKAAKEEYDKYLLKNGNLRVDDEFVPRCAEVAFIGPKDMKLAKTLCAAGSEHRKFLRQIFVSVDITAPLYFWKEADTYKVSTTANSTSTMHKLASTPITLDCFETDDYNEDMYIPLLDSTTGEALVDEENDYEEHTHSDIMVSTIIYNLENLRLNYLKTKDKKYWKELIRWLPESWLQTRTWTCNYETLRGIYQQRKNHKLTEWHKFCHWIESLPYAEDLILS